ncbi:MAG: radical SAM protein [Candidatus Methanoperedens sp.]|nr:radical SAM protein [Candidatus Methanoperedens sp.]
MKITLINPPLVALRGDFLGSGIPSLPVGTPYLAAFLRENGYDVSIIDAFGEKPQQTRHYKDKYLLKGLSLVEILGKIKIDTDLIGISIHSGETFSYSIQLIKEIKKKFNIPIVVGGAFPTVAYKEFISAGVDYVVLSEGEYTLLYLIESLQGKRNVESIDGIVYGNTVNPKTKFIENLDILPFPAIDLLPLENYWKLGYAHGPVSGKYTFLITSRGCPYNCNFCAAPSIWQKKWRTRSPKNVIDEMEYHFKKYGITDFHIQDDNMTFQKERVIKICNEILKRNLKITWKLAAGMKIETVDEKTLIWMKESGCNYISISPETGSKNVLKLMNKPFNYNYALRMVRKTNDLGIKVQACFVLGFPGENDDDLNKTKEYIGRLAKAGVDEIGLFIMTPLLGAEAYDDFPIQEYEELNFSPQWRGDYKKLSNIRVKFYAYFIFIKLIYYPRKMFKSIYNIITRKFEIKMEMTFYRMIRWTIFDEKRDM